MNSRKFKGLVIGKIKEHILTEEHLTKLAYLINEQMDDASREYQEELKLISREEDSISTRLNKLYDAIETGKMKLDDLVPRIQELRKRQEQPDSRKFEIENLVSDRRVELADLKTMTAYVDDLHELLREGSLSDRRAFIRSFGKEIIVTQQEIQPNYTLPLLPDGLTEEKTGVLPWRRLKENECIMRDLSISKQERTSPFFFGSSNLG